MSEDFQNSFYFLSNHAHTLIAIARDPDLRVRDIADTVGITQRAVQKILNELEQSGVIKRVRNGRRTHYSIRRRSKLRHPLESKHSVGELLDLLA